MKSTHVTELLEQPPGEPLKMLLLAATWGTTLYTMLWNKDIYIHFDSTIKHEDLLGYCYYSLLAISWGYTPWESKMGMENLF